MQVPVAGELNSGQWNMNQVTLCLFQGLASLVSTAEGSREHVPGALGANPAHFSPGDFYCFGNTFHGRASSVTQLLLLAVLLMSCAFLFATLGKSLVLRMLFGARTGGKLEGQRVLLFTLRSQLDSSIWKCNSEFTGHPEPPR